MATFTYCLVIRVDALGKLETCCRFPVYSVLKAKQLVFRDRESYDLIAPLRTCIILAICNLQMLLKYISLIPAYSLQDL